VYLCWSASLCLHCSVRTSARSPVLNGSPVRWVGSLFLFYFSRACPRSRVWSAPSPTQNGTHRHTATALTHFIFLALYHFADVDGIVSESLVVQPGEEARFRLCGSFATLATRLDAQIVWTFDSTHQQSTKQLEVTFIYPMSDRGTRVVSASFPGEVWIA
jgi:hypothetical protein